MPHGMRSGKARADAATMRFSAKRNDLSMRRCVDGDVGKNRICDRMLRDNRVLQHRIRKL
jgi:hypothetical protein